MYSFSNLEKENFWRKRYPPSETIGHTLKEYGRGLIGGFIFSLPLLYTMEVWWSGFIAKPQYLLIAVAATYVLLMGYNRFAGMRGSYSWWDIAKDSVEELALGFVTSFIILLLLGRIHFGMSADEILGKTIVESLAVAIGFSVGTSQLGQNGKEEKGEGKEKGKEKQTEDSDDEDGYFRNNGGLFKELVLATCGSFLFAASIAPTDEILLIAVSIEPKHALLLFLFSVALSAVVLFFSNFKGSLKAGSFLKIVFEVGVNYCVALVVSMAFLWFFSRVEGLLVTVVEVVVLAFPASIGASAGRMLIR